MKKTCHCSRETRKYNLKILISESKGLPSVFHSTLDFNVYRTQSA